MKIVEISEAEYQEYVFLKRKEEIRQQEITKMMQQGTHKVKKWRQDLYSTRGFASIFAVVLEKEYERRGRPDIFVLDRWSVVKKYLPEKILTREKGKITIKKYFRSLLKNYGWGVKIDRKCKLFEVRKII